MTEALLTRLRLNTLMPGDEVGSRGRWLGSIMPSFAHLQPAKGKSRRYFGVRITSGARFYRQRKIVHALEKVETRQSHITFPLFDAGSIGSDLREHTHTSRTSITLPVASGPNLIQYRGAFAGHDPTQPCLILCQVCLPHHEPGACYLCADHTIDDRRIGVIPLSAATSPAAFSVFPPRKSDLPAKSPPS